MKQVLREIDEGLVKAGRWFLLSKAFENFVNTLLLIIFVALFALFGGWVLFQFRNMAAMFL